MGDRLIRQRPILENTDLLKNKTVAVVGIGGVGGTAAIALCRAGIGRLILIDHDVFEESNLNRQAFAFRETMGKSKTESAKNYLLNISEDIEIKAYDMFSPKKQRNSFFRRSPILLQMQLIQFRQKKL